MVDMLAFDDGRCRVHIGHVLEELAALPADSVHMVCASPPYWSLRDYKGLPDFTWGGDTAHAHDWEADPAKKMSGGTSASTLGAGGDKSPEGVQRSIDRQMYEAKPGSSCACGAWRGQLGLEPTPDLYVAHMVEVFEAVRRVLRPDGTCWLNLGDCYTPVNRGHNAKPRSHPGYAPQMQGTHWAADLDRSESAKVPGLKQKDLVGIPWRVAFALQAAGWWLRSAITWCKRAPMPESIRDRPTSATEMVFLLTKSETYFYDNLGFAEPSVSDHASGNGYGRPEQISRGGPGQEARWEPQKTRNMRNYWVLGPEPYPSAHFAVFPSEIPRRAILLGTSERGCCPACGASWGREIEQRPAVERGPEYTGKHSDSSEHEGGRRILGAVAAGRAAGLPHDNPIQGRTTIDWEPGCTCAAATTTPAIILDPFLGSGTTLEVAASLGRRGVGIEGNPTYLPLIEKRLRQGVLL
jgi:DNA modification methylase